MNKLDLILMGIQNLWRRKLRTFLTILGVVIGTSSIVVMLSLGFGMNKSMEDMISSMGSLTTINVRKPWEERPGSKTPSLDDKAVKTFKAIPNVEAVSPTLEEYMLLKDGKYQGNFGIKGIDADTLETFGFKVSEGQLLSPKDDMSVLYGSAVASSFYDPKAHGQYKEPNISLMDDKIYLTFSDPFVTPEPGKVIPKDIKLKPMGILEPGGFDKDYSVFMTIESVRKIQAAKEKMEGKKKDRGKKKGYEVIDVKVNNIDNVKSVQEHIKELGYEAYSLNDELDSFKQQSKVTQAILGGIGAISLLVAAIGITNTMIMSIYERTKEIGVMKVIGASIKDIRSLFLFESAMIGFLGGFVGVVLSYGLSYALNIISQNFMGGGMGGMGGGSQISVIPVWLSFAAMGFSALIGIASGYFPAKRAMNLSALEAIKTE